jgi:hypothetical protein
MSALCARLIPIVGFAGALVLRTSIADAASKDTEAQELAKKAIYTDYLGTKFSDAEKKLNQAIALCAPAGACAPKLRAQLFCNLAIVYIGGMNRGDDGKAQFAEALKLDASVAPDPDLVSPEIEAAFAEVKRSPGSAASGVPKPPPPPPPPPSSNNGDLVHSAPTEQATLTPLPLYVELPANQTAARVQLSYKPFGATEWKALEMKPMGKGYGVEIPCVEIGSSQGDLAYYIQAFDSTQNLVSWTGSRAAPNKVAIRVSLQGEAPHLPGQPPSARCAEAADCPPEFPGCHGGGKPPACDPASADCVPPPEEKPAFKKNWISLTVQQDFLVLSGSTHTCDGTAGYDCFQANGQTYLGLPYPKSGDQVAGGAGVATTRILAGYDRVLGTNFTIGARLGVAFRGGPAATQADGSSGRPFFPFHGELRAAYWFGNEPFARTGPRPYVVLGGGVAQVDSSVNVLIYNQPYTAGEATTPLTAWRKAGTGMITGGVGMLFAPGPRHGPFLEFKLMELLGATSTSFDLAVGYAFGL